MSRPSAIPDAPPPRTQPRRGRSAVVPVVCWTYAALLVGAFLLFRTNLALPVGSETSMSLPRAVLTVANAATLTGLQTTLTVDGFRAPAQWTLLVLMMAGGVLSWVVGGVLVARVIGLDVRDRHLLLAAGGLLAAAVAVGLASARPADGFHSVFRAVSAVTNAGLWPGAPPRTDQPALAWLWLPLAVLGGLGATVLVELFRWPSRPQRGISAHAKAVLALTAAAYLVGVAFVAGGEWLAGRAFILERPADVASADPATDAAAPPAAARLTAWRQPLATAAAQSVNVRSAGLPIGWLTDLSRPTQWLLSLPMLAGGCPGGAAGGFKLTTLLVLAVGVMRAWRGQPVGQVVAFAAVWLAIYQATAFAAFVGLLTTVPELSADRLLMLAISAVGNVGLSHDTVSVGRHGSYVLAIAMLAGRILPLLALWRLAALAEREPVPVAVG